MRPARRKPAPQSRTPRSTAAGPEERADELLARLEAGGPNLVKAAEELDRLQPSLERAGHHESVRESVAQLSASWAAGPIRGEAARAWLTLVGGYGVREHTARAGALAADRHAAAD